MNLPAIFGILIAIGGPMAIAITAIISDYRAKQKRYEAMIKAVELGRSPEEVKMMFDEEKKENGKDVNSRLRGGIIVIAVALGLAAMAAIIHRSFAFHGFYLAAAAFLLILGLALILIWWISKPKTK